MAHESKQCGYLQATNTMQKGKYPDLRDTRQHLHNSILSPNRRLPQAFTHKPSKRKEKGVATSLFHVDPSTTAPSSGLAPLEHVRLDNVHLSTMCTSRQRAPLGHVRLSSTCTSRQLSQVLTQTPLCSLRALPPHERPSARPPPRAPRVFPVSANREDTPPLPPAFPRFGNRQMRMMRICCYVDPRGRFGGKPRRRHAASPSVPRGV